MPRPPSLPPISQHHVDARVAHRCSTAFCAAAGDEVVGALEGEHGVVFAVDRELRLQYFNPSWERFALANGGENCLAAFGIGSCVRSAIPDVLWRFYERGFSLAFADEEPWAHVYECSSPSVARSFRMRAARLPDGSHLIVSNDSIREVAADPSARTASALYVNGEGVMVQCSHCRRCRRIDAEVWDWVPELVAEPAAWVSHGLCDPCLAYHYGDHAMEARAQVVSRRASERPL